MSATLGMADPSFTYDSSRPPVLPAQPPITSPPTAGSQGMNASIRMLEGSTNFKIKDSILTNAQNVTIYRFDVGSPLSEEFKSVFTQHIAGSITIEDLDKIQEKMERYALSQVIRDLPRVSAAYDDYTPSNMRRVVCFEGTRQAVLEEIAQWLTSLDGPRAHLLFGIAGVGKSTVAQTVAERARNLRLLGASFFFSRDEAERSNAKYFFTTIAFQLCLYNKDFAQAIEKALLTERGLAAVTKDPIIQLEALILEPLQSNSRPLPTLIVVDALDECDNHDVLLVLSALNRLIQELPYFKVMITTRPEPHLPPSLSSHKVFHMQNIEHKIVDNDIRRYLEYNLSWSQVSVCMPSLPRPWGASNHELESLVQAAGRLFIMASTAIRFILDTTVYDPKSQIEALQADGRVSLDSLENFYTVILRQAVPPNKPMVAQRFRSVIGTILVVQEPLPVKTLECLTQSRFASAIRPVLVNLQSVVALNNDIPHIYHKSFFDYLTNSEHCAKDLLIDMKEHHTQLAIRCLEIMNNTLRQNILDLGTPARFMNNDAGLAAEKISPEQLEDKISHELRYACVYWANHVEGAGSEDANLRREVDTFIKEHLLHWLEALSWIRKLDMATHALRVILNSMKSLSSDLNGIISYALYFVPKFYDKIHHAALHVYYSALPLIPTESLLFQSQSKEMTHCLCRPEFVPAQGDALIARAIWHRKYAGPYHVTFSNDSSKFAMSHPREMALANAENGARLRTFAGDKISIAYDFSTVAVLQGTAVTLWNVASNTLVATITQSEKVIELALCFDGSRLAAGLSNGTVTLWNAWKGELIATLIGYSHNGGQLEFSPIGYRIVFVSDDGALYLWDGYNGELVSRLNYMSKKHTGFTFSRNGSRLVSPMVESKGYSLTLWDGETGNLIDVAETLGPELAISEDGSFIATTGRGLTLQLWSGNPLSLIDTIDDIDNEWWIVRLTLSHDVLAIGRGDSLTLYDIKNRTLITTLQPVHYMTFALSPDCTRLAGVNSDHSSLYDVSSLKMSMPASREPGYRTTVSVLAFSPDATRLASGCQDGTVQLWDATRILNQPIAAHKHHLDEINMVAFSFSGDIFASGSDDRTVRLWDSGDGAPLCPLGYLFPDLVMSVAFSRSLLATATKSSIVLFDAKSLGVVHVLDIGGDRLSFSADGSRFASLFRHGQISAVVVVWNVEGWVAIATIEINFTCDGFMLSPDGSQLAVQSPFDDDGSIFFDVDNMQAIERTERQDISWFPNLKNGVLISFRWDKTLGSRIVGRFPGYPGCVPVLWIPHVITRIANGPSVIAMGCYDGRILLVRY